MRKFYLDNLKWVTVVIVVLYHVIYMFNGVQTAGVIGPFSAVQYQDAFQYLVYPWFMLLMFIISGMSARFELEKKNHREFLKSRVTKFLVPSTIGVLVFGWILGYYNMQISGAFDTMPVDAMPKLVLYIIECMSGIGVLWYIQMLFVFSLILVCVRKIEKDKLYSICKKVNIWLILAFVVLIYGSAQILNTPVIVVYRFGIYGVGFFLGYYVFSHEEVMQKVGKAWAVFVILGIASAIAFLIMYWGKPYAEHVVLDTVMCNIFAWFASLAVLSFAYKKLDFENKATQFMKKKSFGLYVFHYLPLAASGFYLTQSSIKLPVIVIYIIVGLCAFLGAFVLNEVISRIPFLRWAILGIKKTKTK